MSSPFSFLVARTSDLDTIFSTNWSRTNQVVAWQTGYGLLNVVFKYLRSGVSCEFQIFGKLPLSLLSL
eukprot:7914323-Pyramimonas_sp.AAC.1